MQRDLVGYGKSSPKIQWPDDARIAVSLVVHYEEGAEQTPLEGDTRPESDAEGVINEGGDRDFMVESLFEFGARRGFWRLLELFDRQGVPVTFFCSGQALERNPVAAAEITAHGHEVCGHGYRWVPEYELTREQERAHIHEAVRSIRDTTGQRPLGWNSRGPSIRTRELLVEEGGFLYDSDSYGDDLPYTVDVGGRKLLTVPYTLDVNDNKFWAHLRLPGFTNSRDFFDMMRGTFDVLYSEGATHPKMMSVGMHLRISGKPSRAKQVESFIEYVKGFPGVWFARRVDIARWWLEHYAAL